MGVITGFSAARMLEIENASVVNGLIDTYGNLILSRKDGSSFDAGRVVDVGTPEQSPNTIVARNDFGRTKFAEPLELNDADTKGARDTAISTAIATEVTARNTAIASEATARANADAAEVIARDTAISTAIAAKTNILPIDTYASGTPVSSYPWGTSHMLVSPLAGWADPGLYGSVTTIRPYTGNPGGAIQYWSSYQNNNTRVYYRQWFYSASAWSAWSRIVTYDELSDGVAARVCRLTKTSSQSTSATAGATSYMSWTADSFASGMFDGNTAIYPNRNGKWRVTFKARGVASASALYGQVVMLGVPNSPSEGLAQNSVAGPYITATDVFNVTNVPNVHFQAAIYSLGTNHQIIPANCVFFAEYLGP